MITAIIEDAKKQISSGEEIIKLYTTRIETEKDAFERAQLTTMIEMTKLDIMYAQNNIKRLQNTSHERAIVDAYKLVKDNISEQLAIAEQSQIAHTHLAAAWLTAHGLNNSDMHSKTEYESAVKQLETLSANVDFLKNVLTRLDTIEVIHYPKSTKKEK